MKSSEIQSTISYVIGKISIYLFIGAAFYYFIILSPGVFVNAFPPSEAKCAELIPYPVAPFSIIHDCTSSTPDLELLPICEARKTCGYYFQSGYTSPVTVGVQGVVFFVFLLFLYFYMYEWYTSTFHFLVKDMRS